MRRRGCIQAMGLGAAAAVAAPRLVRGARGPGRAKRPVRPGKVLDPKLGFKGHDVP
jgi:hypothetical protein